MTTIEVVAYITRRSWDYRPTEDGWEVFVAWPEATKLCLPKEQEEVLGQGSTLMDAMMAAMRKVDGA